MTVTTDRSRRGRVPGPRPARAEETLQHLSRADRVDFAETYADQNERDYAAFQAAVGDGRVEAVTGI